MKKQNINSGFSRVFDSKGKDMGLWRNSVAKDLAKRFSKVKVVPH
jgi:hypothetical protein